MTIGNFDGVHRGHQTVLKKAREEADRAGLPVVAVSFDPHPMAVLRPEHAPSIITPVDRRADLLEDAGADHVLALAFDMDMAGWSPQEFVDRVVVGALKARVVVVGANFRFGHRAAGDVALLREAGETAGFTAVGVELEGGPQVWSSTYVRTCLAAGDVAGAAEALGHLVRRARRGRRGRPAWPRAGVPDRQRAGRPAGCGPGRRRVRRLAAEGRRRDVVPRRDQRRHQPDVRRTPGAAGRGLRCSTAPTWSSTASRSRSRSPSGSGGWSGSTASRPWSRPCTTTWPGPARS